LLQDEDIIPRQKKDFELLTVKNLNLSGKLPLDEGEKNMIEEKKTDWAGMEERRP